MKEFVLPLLVGLINAKSYFHETFPSDYVRPPMEESWVNSRMTSKVFSLEWGRERTAESYGLFAGKANSQYGISSPLKAPLDLQEVRDGAMLSLQFDMVQEESQVCGDYQIKLFGNGESGFKPEEMSIETPSLLRFGARYCEAVSNIEIAFVSLSDGNVHAFKPNIALPNDEQPHTYRLDWSASSDSYAVFIDSTNYKSGKITEDFDGFYTENEIEQGRPRDWDDRPYYIN